MMYIIYKDYSENRYHIDNPEIEIDMVASNEVVQVQADGHELEYIKNNFVNIPYSKTQKVQNWYGEFARFIIANW